MSAFEVGDKVGPKDGARLVGVVKVSRMVGVVIGVHPDGTFTVRWSDGSIEKGCQPSLAVKIK